MLVLTINILVCAAIECVKYLKMNTVTRVEYRRREKNTYIDLSLNIEKLFNISVVVIYDLGL